MEAYKEETALEISRPKATALAKGNDWTRDQVELIKRTVAKGATDDELKLFLYTAQRMGLDPLAKQIHAVKRWDKNAQREVMAIQVGIDGFRLVADRTGKYAPGKNTEYEMEQDRLIAATAYVKKMVSGTWHEFGETAYYTEYVANTKEGRPTRMWAQFPRTMLAKCAEARALRRAFPAELSGVYAFEEMDQAGEIVNAMPCSAPCETAPKMEHKNEMNSFPPSDKREQRQKEIQRKADAEALVKNIADQLGAEVVRGSDVPPPASVPQNAERRENPQYKTRDPKTPPVKIEARWLGPRGRAWAYQLLEEGQPVGEITLPPNQVHSSGRIDGKEYIWISRWISEEKIKKHQLQPEQILYDDRGDSWEPPEYPDGYPPEGSEDVK